jgi:hypothetical protein
MQPRPLLTPIALISDDTQNALITKQLSEHINSLYTKARVHLQEQKSHFAPERLHALLEKIIQQLNYVTSNFSYLNRDHNPVLFHLKSMFANFDTDIDKGWKELITYLNPNKIITLKDINSHDFRLLLAIRHECDAAFTLTSLMPNQLDKTIALLNTKQDINEEDCQQLLQDLIAEYYYLKKESEEELKVDQLIQLIPTMKLLIEKNLLTKFNFVRLLLYPNPRVDMLNHKGSNTHYYEYPSEFYYYRSVISCELTAQAVALLAQRNILTQYNLEALFKVFKIYVNEPRLLELQGWGFTQRLTTMTDRIAALKIDPHNDAFEATFLKAWFGNRYTELTATELTRVADSALFDLTAHVQKQLSEEIVTTLAKHANTPLLTGSDGDAKEEATTALAQIVQQIPFTTPEEIATASEHAEDLAKMQLSLHRDGIATPQNLLTAFKNAKQLAAVTKTYNLVQETHTFETPQATLDAIVPIAHYAENINAMLLWLPPEQRNAGTAGAIIENARFAGELLPVCAYEHKHYNEASKFSAFINIFGRAVDLKIEYLPALQEIYEFLAKWDSGLNAQNIDCLNPRMALTPAIARGLKKGYKEGMSSEEMHALWNSVLNKAESEHLEDAKKWSLAIDDFVSSLNQCEVLVSDSPEDERTLKRSLNAAYLIFYHPNAHHVYYSNQAKGIEVELKLTRRQVNQLRARFKLSAKLDAAQLNYIKKITGHEHTVISPEISAVIRKKSSYNAMIDKTQLMQGYMVLISGECFEKGYPVIEDYPEYALGLASALVELKKHDLLEDQYIELLKMQRDLAPSIATVLIYLKQEDQLTPVILESFKMRINDAPQLANACRDGIKKEKLAPLLIQTIPVLQPSEHKSAYHNNEEVSDEDEEKVIAPPKQRLSLPPAEALTLPSASGLDRRKSSTPGDEKDFEAFHSPVLSSSPPAALHVRQDSFSLNSFESEKEEFFNEVINRCISDYKGTFFGRSNFLSRIQNRSNLDPKDRIDTIEDIRLYAMTHPNSRTARIYAQVYTERSFDPEVKEFLTEYFKEFNFSWYQKSTLVQKLFNDEIEGIDTIEQHAKDNPNPNNRTARILANLRR